MLVLVRSKATGRLYETARLSTDRKFVILVDVFTGAEHAVTYSEVKRFYAEDRNVRPNS